MDLIEVVYPKNNFFSTIYFSPNLFNEYGYTHSAGKDALQMNSWQTIYI